MTLRSLSPVALVLLSVAACTAPSDLDVERVQRHERVCAEGPLVPGIDVSSWQGDALDWDALAAGGDADFAFIRAMHGLQGDGFNDGPDAHFDLNWAEAGRVGMLRGAYQYFIAGEDPTAQADFMIAKLSPMQTGDLPPVIDIEVRDTDPIVPVPQIIENVGIWLDRVETQLGVRPIVYTSQSMWTRMTEDSELFSDYPLWVAHYNTECPRVPGAWNSWVFHQYSSTGGVAGYDGNIDKNRFAGTIDALRLMAEHEVIPPEMTPDAAPPAVPQPDGGNIEEPSSPDPATGCAMGGGSARGLSFLLLFLILGLRRSKWA